MKDRGIGQWDGNLKSWKSKERGTDHQKEKFKKRKLYEWKRGKVQWDSKLNQSYKIKWKRDIPMG